MKKLMTLFAVTFALMLTTPVFANVEISPVTIWTDGGLGPGGGHMGFNSFSDGTKVLAVKSSNKKVLKVKYKKGDDPRWSIWLTGIKPGNSRVTITYQDWSGKHTTSAVYTVKKYPKVFKSFTVNGKKVDFSKYPDTYWGNGKGVKNVKIKYKLNKGWKLTRTEGVYYEGGRELYFKPVNGKKFAFKKPKMFVNYEFRKGKDVFFYTVAVRMPGA